MKPKIYTVPSSKSLPPANRWDGRAWAIVCLMAGGVGLVFMYAAVMINPLRDWLHGLEHGVFKSLNSSMGRNAGWDWTIIICDSDFWVLGSLVFLMIIGAWEGWRLRHRDYGRVFGYLVFVAVAGLVTLEAADFIADEVERRLPWRQDAILAMIERYDAEFIDFESRAGILSDIIAVWFMGLALISRRLPRTALAGAALLAAYAGASLTIGSEWLLGQAAAVFFGSAIGGAGLLASRKPLHWAERKSSDVFLKFFWRSLYHEALNHPGEPGRLRLISRIKKLRHEAVPRRERFWRRLVESEVLPLLRHDGEAYELSETPPGPPQPEFRGSRRVRFLTINSGEHYVIRGIWRWGGVFAPSAKFRRYAESARCNYFLAGLGLPVAQVFWVSEKVSRGGLQSVGFCIEQFLLGRPLDLENEAEVGRAVALLARMHGHTSPNWGAVADAVKRAPSQYLLQFLRQDVLYFLRKGAEWLDIEMSQHDMERIWKMFEAEALALLSQDSPRFRLIHSDVHFRNILIDEAGKPWLVDFGEVCFDLAGWEIVKSAVALGLRRPERCRKIWAEYFKAAGEERWREFQGEARLGLARFALRELAMKRALGAATRGEINRQDLLKWLEDLFVKADDWWGQRPEDTNWQALVGLMCFKAAKADSDRVAAEIE